jgi:hypothetical protein
VGDQVQWTHRRVYSKSFLLTTRKGEILEVREGFVQVKYKGEAFWLPKDRVRSVTERSELSEAMCAPTGAEPGKGR